MVERSLGGDIFKTDLVNGAQEQETSWQEFGGEMEELLGHVLLSEVSHHHLAAKIIIIN